ncbi:enoyl-CoA hydratase [Acuticoccus sediminis]|uniref:Enoyl-CoA hydratase n=1 Tax=Acuticoccus sediminis TaxID=2184697 RepID=A0A8B2NKW1_9HYPH|nr:enoyl-CoA hydratase-related protein [Acuticoccus sediminis]RAH96785.1 enoyl-CoA hydratase [Acuticoccus sediminis]
MSFVDIERHGRVALLALNSPADRNALSRQDQCDALAEALHEVNAEQDVHVAVLTGRGPAFCAGGNVKDMRTKAGFMAGTPTEMERAYRRGLHRIPLAFQALEVPVIAAVNGPAMGAGLDIAAMCDLRIASTEARFAEVFVRLGIISGIGGAWFLPRVLGPARAAELAFTGRVLDAGTALQWGLVSEVTEPGALLDRALTLAGEMAQHSGVALRYYKRLIRMGTQQDLATALDATAALQVLAHSTPEHEAAVDAMLSRMSRRESAS